MRPVPPPSDEIDFMLWDRFLAGECSPAEAELVRRWLASQEADARYLEAMRDALQSRAATTAAPNNADALWVRLARDTVGAERNAERLPPPLRRLAVDAPGERHGLGRALAAPWLRVAAVVTLLVGAAAVPFAMKNRIWSAISAAAKVAPVREYATAPGERTELRLPDGTRVMLAPDSRLEVPADFATTERMVTLAGQAYFDVKHDDQQPLQVRARHGVAYDLGTRFDVRAYPGDEAVQVVVAEGKVQLAAATGTGPVLGQGDMGRLDAAGRVTTERVNLATALAWTRGELVFDDTPLSDVAIELARWYDLDVQVSDPMLRQKRVTLTLGAESAPEAVEAVALLASARHEQQGRVVTFTAMSSRRETDR